MNHRFKSTLSTVRISDRPRGLPEHFPEILRLEATVAINEAFGEFRSDHLVIERCDCIFSKLTKAIVAAVRTKQITAEAILTAMDDLLWHLLPYEDSQDLADMVRTCAGWCEIPRQLLTLRESAATTDYCDEAPTEVAGKLQSRVLGDGGKNHSTEKTAAVGLPDPKSAVASALPKKKGRRRVDRVQIDRAIELQGERRTWPQIKATLNTEFNISRSSDAWRCLVRAAKRRERPNTPSDPIKSHSMRGK